MNTTARILIVDRDPVAPAALSETLSYHGYTCEVAEGAEQALACLDRADVRLESSIGVLIVDQDSAGTGGGLEMIRRLCDHRPSLVPIIVSGFRKIESAVLAMRLGAADYLLKPLVEDELIHAVQRATQRHLLLADDGQPDDSPDSEDQPQAEQPPHETPATTHGDLPGSDAWHPMPLAEAMKEPERQILIAALEANGWNRGQTARQLDINRTTLYKKIRQYRLDEPA